MVATYFELTLVWNFLHTSPILSRSMSVLPCMMRMSTLHIYNYYILGFQLRLHCVKSTFAQLTSFTMLRSWPSTYRILSPLSSHFTKQTVKVATIIRLVWRKFYTSKRCQFRVYSHHPLYYCITFTRSFLSCLLSFYGIPIFHTF